MSMPEEAMLGGGLEAWSFTSTQEDGWGVAIGSQKAMRVPWALEYLLNEVNTSSVLGVEGASSVHLGPLSSPRLVAVWGLSDVESGSVAICNVD